ncbi:MAG: AzlD domain-containing protein [Oleiphilaceae bacterium]|nr:AzlD domain-containing protein [Oleiphilaceae bacterium]
MGIETTTPGIVAIIAVVWGVTLVTRWAGPFLMQYIPLHPRVESFISAMASSVLIAIVVPLAFAGDLGARAALLSTALIMLWTGRVMPAIGVGLAAAALVRQLF